MPRPARPSAARSHPSGDGASRSGAAHAAILGTGRALPSLAVPSSALDAELGLEAGRLEALTGVRTRYRCARGEDQITLGTKAARLALADAALGVDAIDCVISAAAVPWQSIPSTAPAMMAALGMADGSARAFDVNATCLGFLVALDCADAMIATGRVRHVLVICADLASRALPWRERPDVAGLFGDGAAAAVVGAASAGMRAMPQDDAGHDTDRDTGGSGRADGPRFVAHLLETRPGSHDACQLGAGGTRYDYHADPALFEAHSRFRMDGRELFRVTAEHFPPFVERLLARAGWRVDEVDRVVPHQASPLALRHMARGCGFAPSRIVDIASEVGNQVAASLPFALDCARRGERAASRIEPGSRVLMLGTSAGVSFGGTAYVA